MSRQLVEPTADVAVDSFAVGFDDVIGSKYDVVPAGDSTGE